MLPLGTSLGTVLAVEAKVVDTSSSGELDAVFRWRLLRITGGAMQSLGYVWFRDYPGHYGYYTGTIDPDGSGSGLIGIAYTDPLNCFYEFRRVLVSRQQPGKKK
jgi:hypothetical protein